MWWYLYRKIKYAISTEQFCWPDVHTMKYILQGKHLNYITAMSYQICNITCNIIWNISYQKHVNYNRGMLCYLNDISFHKATSNKVLYQICIVQCPPDDWQQQRWFQQIKLTFKGVTLLTQLWHFYNLWG